MIKKILIFALLMVGLSGCTQCESKKPDCELTDKYAEWAAGGLATTFDCKNPAAIAESIKGTVDRLNLCENRGAGISAELICKPVSTFVTAKLVDLTLPAEWECSGGVPAQSLERFLYTACTSIPF